MCLYKVFSFFFVKQKTAYEMRISDWSSDVCSSDLLHRLGGGERVRAGTLEHAHDHGGLAREIGVRGIIVGAEFDARHIGDADLAAVAVGAHDDVAELRGIGEAALRLDIELEGVALRIRRRAERARGDLHILRAQRRDDVARGEMERGGRSEEERRGGKECGSTFGSRGSREHIQKKKK